MNIFVFDFLGIATVVGGVNPSEKYVPQIGSLPQVGVKIKMLETAT